MTSYLRDWLFSAVPPQSPPTIELISPPASDDDGEETETERNDDDDDDSPPAFPALNSAQRLHTSKNSTVPTDSQLMPPPPVGISISSPSTLAVPPTTTKAPVRNSKKRGKVALAPGHSPLDWAALKASGQDLRVSITIKKSQSLLRSTIHLSRESTLCCVYLHQYSSNIINGMMPGLLSMERYIMSPPICHFILGERKRWCVLLDEMEQHFSVFINSSLLIWSHDLIATTHGWVNVDFMLDTCLVGFLVREPPS